MLKWLIEYLSSEKQFRNNRGIANNALIVPETMLIAKRQTT
jgi:hypothetical protein